METEKEQIEALRRTDVAMWQLLVVLGVTFGLAYFLAWWIAATIGLLLASVPLYRWLHAEFNVWNRGGPAGEQANSSATPEA